MKPLNIAVCVKPVPDPKESAGLKIDPVSKTLVRKGIPLVINPLDKHALEAALQLKDAAGGRVVTVSMAPPDAEMTMAETLVMGADEAALLSDIAFAGGDTLATARVLVAGLKKLGSWDIVLCGGESFDGATAQVGPQLGVLMGFNWISWAHKIERIDDDTLLVTVEDEVELRELKVKLPVVITVEASLNKPRRLSMLGIVASRGKKINVFGSRDLDVDVSGIGLNGSPTQTLGYFSNEDNRTVEMITGSPQQVASGLLDKLGW